MSERDGNRFGIERHLSPTINDPASRDHSTSTGINKLDYFRPFPITST